MLIMTVRITVIWNNIVFSLDTPADHEISSWTANSSHSIGFDQERKYGVAATKDGMLASLKKTNGINTSFFTTWKNINQQQCCRDISVGFIKH